MSGENDLVKVLIETEDGDESLWAEPMGGNRFRLDNAPFFAYGISADDVVEATEVAEGFYRFDRIAEKGGSRTLRLFTGESNVDDPLLEPFYQALEALSCAYEGFQPKMLSITIPKGVDIKSVMAHLAETGHLWEHADPTYADIYGAE